jgi:hypothetical protein
MGATACTFRNLGGVLASGFFGACLIAISSLADPAMAQPPTCQMAALDAIATGSFSNVRGACTENGQTVNYTCSRASSQAGSCSTSSGQTINIACSNASLEAGSCNITGACTGTFTPSTRSFAGACSGLTSNVAQLATQAAARAAVQASFVSLGAVDTHITNVRDFLQARLTPTGPTLGSAGDVVSGNAVDTPFASMDSSSKAVDNELAGLALSYNNPTSLPTTKAPPAPPPLYSWAAWGQGFVDHENYSGSFMGVDVGRNTTTGGGIGGVDVTRTGLFSAGDAGVLGILAGDTSAYIRNATGSTANVDGPGVGVYGLYVKGPFSADATFKTDFLSLSQTVPGAPTGVNLNNYAVSGDLNYKNEMGSWWWEPTIGVSDVRTIWGTGAGISDGNDVRVTGGVRWGTGWDWAGVHFLGVLSTFLYDDVSITGGSITTAVAPSAPTYQGKVFGQGIGKLAATINQHWSAYIEVEVRGTTDVFGVAGRIGARYTF